MSETLLLILLAGSAIYDVETTQSCLQRNTCHESNPIMPDSRAGQYAVKAATLAPLVLWRNKWALGGAIAVQVVTGTLNLRF